MESIKFHFLLALGLALASGCSKDDDATPANQPPAAFEVMVEVNANSVDLNWTAATDPEGDAVSYEVELEGAMVATDLTGLGFTVDDLNYEQSYSGKVIATDAGDLSTETNFTFTTDFLWLRSYESFGTENFLSFDSNGRISGIEAGGGNIPIAFDSNGNISLLGIVSFGYDSGGLITSINDGNGPGIIE